ncbi:heparin lyase I family protein [Alistipes sp.]|uniref:heparin lyase I family protein n=1 Tax=Alistipes sp. TaxID=1872444 RepID=UPI003AEFA82A
MKTLSTTALFLAATLATATGLAAEPQPELEPFPARVNVQADSARTEQIADGEWVAVGIRKPESIRRDRTRPYEGRPSWRFELGRSDNTLSGYAPGETKGRAELSYCYATAADFADLTAQDYVDAQKMKTVYHHGKGICPQGSKWTYTFAVYIPSTLSPDVQTIFAQWHGMPDRTLVTAPDGQVRRLSVAEFVAMQDTVVIKKDTAYERVAGRDKRGKEVWKAGKPTGWKVEQGGYPPLAFGFSGGWFYIKANSDRRWFTDKSDRCNANPEKAGVLKPVTSEFKSSTIAYRLPFGDFPKDRWVRFTVEVDWTRYGGAAQSVEAPGRLDVRMAWDDREEHIVDNAQVLIGRNDEEGYYFKYGIYRVGGSSEPVCYNLAGYTQQPR